MTSRIRCRKCGAESYADGATIFCRRCFDELIEFVEEVALKPYTDSNVSSLMETLQKRGSHLIVKIRLAGYRKREDWPKDDEAELTRSEGEQVNEPGASSCSNCQWRRERDLLLDMTMELDEHPEGYEGPCICQMCCSYGD